MTIANSTSTLSPTTSQNSTIQVQRSPPYERRRRGSHNHNDRYNRGETVTRNDASTPPTPNSSRAITSPAPNGFLDRPAPLACTECRRKHVRCDATTPVCQRCESAGLTCHYLPSRRGLKRRADDLDTVAAAASMASMATLGVATTGRPLPENFDPSLFIRREIQFPSTVTTTDRWTQQVEHSSSNINNTTSGDVRTSTASPSPINNVPNSDVVNVVSLTLPSQSLSPPPLPPASAWASTTLISPQTTDHRHGLNSRPRRNADITFNNNSTDSTLDVEDIQVVDDDALINLYYTNFHGAHPILVPRTMYSAQRYPAYLRLVVHFIGSHFSMTGQSDTLRHALSKALAVGEQTERTEAGDMSGPEKNRYSTAASLPRTYHLVQARLLLSIALHARGEIRESVSVLAQAVSTALDIGMSRRSFGESHGGGIPIVEESLRRTWWELYVVDGFVAALQRSISFRSHECEPDVLLPCDEMLYAEAGVFAMMQEAPTLEQFDARIYADEDSPQQTRFSSFCYRVDAVRILARALAISSAHEVQEEQVQAIENALAAWRHSLVTGKNHILDAFGHLDEMLFQAHMLIHYTAIYLHFWRSDLAATVPAAFDIIRERHLPPVSTRHTHGIKAVEASKQLVDLAALSTTTIQKHTPFFVFAIVFSAIVQLSACALHGPEFHGLYRDRLALITGVLTTLSPIWSFSHAVGRKFKRMTADLLRNNGAAPTTSSASKTSYIGSDSNSNSIDASGGFYQDSAVDLTTPGRGLHSNGFPWMDLLSWDPVTQSL